MLGLVLVLRCAVLFCAVVVLVLGKWTFSMRSGGWLLAGFVGDLLPTFTRQLLRLHVVRTGDRVVVIELWREQGSSDLWVG